MRSLPTVPLLTHGAVVSLAVIIAVGLVLSGSARFRPDPQSAEAAPAHRRRQRNRAGYCVWLLNWRCVQ